MQSRRAFIASSIVLLLIVAVTVGAWAVYRQHPDFRARLPWLSTVTTPRTARMQRPYGMAPAAFDAYLRACLRAGVNPDRIGQTIGDYPMSKGYHKRDGALTIRGRRIDYCTAVDLGVFDLDETRINKLLHELTIHGFACWYRHGGKWKGGEHIHAVYAFLPMKHQLHDQLINFLRERREAGLKPLQWEKKLRRRLRYRIA
jgi:hypothetical protein